MKEHGYSFFFSNILPKYQGSQKEFNWISEQFLMANKYSGKNISLVWMFNLKFKSWMNSNEEVNTMVPRRVSATESINYST